MTVITVSVRSIMLTQRFSIVQVPTNRRIVTCERKGAGHTSITCANCSNSKDKNVKEKCKTHSAADRLCPSYVIVRLRELSYGRVIS